LTPIGDNSIALGMQSASQEITVLDLFSGIRGLSLGLHWAGMRTTAFCEADPFARVVLARHWPGVPIYADVRTLTAARLRADGVPRPGLLCGGFPCQDISLAGRTAGIEGPRSGLWSHMARLVRECRPRWVVAEIFTDKPQTGDMEGSGAGLEAWQPAPARTAPGLPVERRGGWPAEPALRRVDDGFPRGMDRNRRACIRALGNAVVPANAAMIGGAIRAAPP